MMQLLETEAFIHDWTLWSGPVAAFMPPNFGQISEVDWDLCETVYTLVPLDGRHQDATYRLQFTFKTSPTETESRIGRCESTIELPLRVDVQSDGFVHFLGEDMEGNRVLELGYDHDVAAEHLGEFSDYESIVVQFEYQEALLAEQADMYDSLEDARTRFVEYIHHQNESLGWENDPQATFEP